MITVDVAEYEAQILGPPDGGTKVVTAVAPRPHPGRRRPVADAPGRRHTRRTCLEASDRIASDLGQRLGSATRCSIVSREGVTGRADGGGCFACPRVETNLHRSAVVDRRLTCCFIRCDLDVRRPSVLQVGPSGVRPSEIIKPFSGVPG
jgi:hypothetical protein